MGYVKRFDLRIPDELHARLQAVADRERRSIHAQILKLLEDGLDREEAQGASRRQGNA